MDPTIDEQRIDATLRRFLAADADELAEGAVGEFEMAARVRAHLGSARPEWRLVLLVAAALLIASLAATAIGVGTGLIRPPWTSDLQTDSHGQLVVFAYDDPLPTPGPGTFDRQPGKMVLVDPGTGRLSTLASMIPAAAYAKISPGANPTKISWSTDGSQMSFETDGSKVWVADALGVHSPAACGNGNPCWSELSPDGRYLALNSDFGPSVVSVATGEGPRVVPSTGNWFPEEMTWSPDSLRLAVGIWTGTGYSLMIVNRDGSDLHELTSATSGPGPDATGHPRMSSLDWSPDGSRIAYLLGDDTTAPSLVVVALDGTGPAVLFPNLTSATGVAWSPDGKQLAIVYLADDPTGANFLGLLSLFVVNADGTNLRLVHSYVDGQPTWRPT
jgi:dipeptidyl aminopeptidase/acylaminoacyl peptidase